MVVGQFPLKDRIAVITGGGSGINLSFARLAIKKGARVIIADLRLTADAETFVKQAGAQKVVFAKCDVTKRADLEKLPKASEKAFGDAPDVWIAGAGVFEPVGRSLTVAEGESVDK
jgi:NAD(P)-dependent dehydrogenase (short-subunit alcohol dehydrogenase family)